MVDKNVCKMDIVHVAENNTEIRYSLFDINGKPVVIDDLTESYGADSVNEVISKIDTDLAALDASTKKKRTELTSKKAVLLEVKTLTEA